MSDAPEKRVDESWKEQVEREKQQPEAAAPPAAAPSQPAPPAGERPEAEALPEARFDHFLSGLVMDALIALGDMPHPTTRKQAANLTHARYLVDLLGLLQEKTRGNLSAEEDQLLKDALYQLRMRYLAKSGG